MTRPIYLGDLLLLFLRKHWRSILLAYCVFGLGALIHVAISTKQYQGWVTLSPAEAGQGSGLSSSLAALGSLANVSLPRNPAVLAQDQYLALVQSVQVAQVLVKDQALMREMFPRSWDAQSKRWSQWRGIRDWMDATILRYKYPNFPATADVYTYLQEKVSVDEIKTGSIWRVSVYTSDPVFSRDIIAAINNATDTVLRANMKDANARKLAYIQHQLDTEASSSIKTSLISIQEQNLKTKIDLGSNAPIAFSVIEGPLAETVPSKPSLIFQFLAMIVLCTVGVLAIGFYSIRGAMRDEGA